MGLVDEVVPPDEVLDRALEPRPPRWPPAPSWPRAWPSGPSTAGLDITLNGGLDLEQQLFAEVFAHRGRRASACSRSSSTARARPTFTGR